MGWTVLSSGMALVGERTGGSHDQGHYLHVVFELEPPDEGATALQDAFFATSLAGVRRHSCLSKPGCQVCPSMDVLILWHLRRKIAQAVEIHSPLQERRLF